MESTTPTPSETKNPEKNKEDIILKKEEPKTKIEKEEPKPTKAVMRYRKYTSEEINLLQKQIIAPFLYENELLKKFCWLMLFTNPEKLEFFHILMIGDVGSGKSALAKDVSKCYPKGFILTKKTTPVGLIQTLEDADCGICVLDELDKMDYTVRDTALEPMEDGQVTISTNDFKGTVISRANIIATANPKGDNWSGQPNPRVIPFGKPLISRFNVVLPVKRIPPEKWKQITKSIIETENDKKKTNDTKRFEKIQGMITERLKFFPNINFGQEFENELNEFVAILGKRFANSLLTITPRIIKGMIRMCKARARARGDDNVSREDFEYIKTIIKESYSLWNR